MPKILLTVSGEIDPQIEEKTKQGERPLADYIAMERGLPADLMDYRSARKMGGWIGQVLEKIGGPNLMLAWASFRQCQNYQVLFTDGEQVGLPLALLLKFSGGRQRSWTALGSPAQILWRKAATETLYDRPSYIR